MNIIELFINFITLFYTTFLSFKNVPCKSHAGGENLSFLLFSVSCNIYKTHKDRKSVV